MVDWITVSRQGGTPGEEVGPEEGKGPGGVAAGVDGDQGEGGREGDPEFVQELVLEGSPFRGRQSREGGWYFPEGPRLEC